MTKPKAQLIGFAGTGSLFEAMYRAGRAWDEWDDNDDDNTN